MSTIRQDIEKIYRKRQPTLKVKLDDLAEYVENLIREKGDK